MYIPCTTRLHIPLAHPSCSYYYLLSPSILFFAHLIVLHFLFHCTFYSYFSFFTIYMLLCCYFYIIFIFILLHCPLSGPDFISLLIIPCIICYVTNKETLNLETPSSFQKTLNVSQNTLNVSQNTLKFPKTPESFQKTLKVSQNPLKFPKTPSSFPKTP